ncbi:MAG: hypothetical protein KDK70_09680 [Myxococcales bacterium]|nr:hypothetical protein [Myxococcales bacterium]
MSRALVVAVLVGSWNLALPSVTWAGPAEASSESPATFRELTEQAKQQRAAKAYAEAAHSLADAYGVLSEEEQAGLKGEITVSNAVDDFRRAQEQAPEDLVLLEDEVALLERFEGNPQRQGEMPPGLAEELVRVRARIEVLRPAREEKADAIAQVVEGSESITPAPIEKSQGTVAPQPKPESPSPKPKPPPPRSRDVGGAALLGFGLAAVVSGVSLIGGGVWVFGAADERRSAQLAALDADEYPDEGGLRDGLDQWYQRGRGLGTGLVVGGAVLTGVGVALTAWGAARLRKRGRPTRRRASTLVPVASQRGLGLMVTAAF